jgi:hypothetical protein
MVMGYYRLGKHEDARRSMRQLLTFAEKFRMDNPLTEFGNAVYQPNEPVNLCYDTFGPAAALIRGLFEYLYKADGLTLVPHIPPKLTALEQLFPIRFGAKQLYLSTVGSGPVTGVRLNGQQWASFDATSIFLPYDATPDVAYLEIALGGADFGPYVPKSVPSVEAGDVDEPFTAKAARLRALQTRLVQAGFGTSYEAAHIRLTLDAMAVIPVRKRLFAEGEWTPLPEASQTAADQSYVDTANRLFDGLCAVFENYRESKDVDKAALFRLWEEATAGDELPE